MEFIVKDKDGFYVRKKKYRYVVEDSVLKHLCCFEDQNNPPKFYWLVEGHAFLYAKNEWGDGLSDELELLEYQELLLNQEMKSMALRPNNLDSQHCILSNI